ncbi:histidine phosphatase family protein [Chloroflexota bacterium]
MKLLLVRHGQTDWNRDSILQGHTDLELNQMGMSQVESLTPFIDAQKIDAVYSSDLLRAMQTARILLNGRKDMIQGCDLLREIDFGDLEGMTFNDISSTYPDLSYTEFSFSKYNGESLKQLGERVSDFADEINAAHTDDNTVLITAHGGTLRVLLCILLGIDVTHWWQFKMDLASLTVTQSEAGAAAITILNYTNYAEEMEI